MGESRNALLVHGAWHGPWVWEGTVAALAGRGVAARCVGLPSCGSDPASLGGLDADAEAIGRAAAAIDGDLIVVGHSYGGMAVTAATFGPRVRRLVYLAAFMPVEGAALVSHLPPGPLPPFVAMRDDGAVGLEPSVVRDAFYGDLDAEQAAAAADRLVLHAAAAITTPVARCAWRTIPSTYIVCGADRVIPPQLQRLMAAHATEVRELAASHSPMLSRPADLAAMLADIAAG